MPFRLHRSLIFWAGLWRDSLSHHRTLWAVCGRGVCAVENSSSALRFSFSPSKFPTSDLNLAGLLDWQLEHEAIPFWRRKTLFPMPQAAATDRDLQSLEFAPLEDDSSGQPGLLAPWWLLLTLHLSLWLPLVFWLRRRYNTRAARADGTRDARPILHL